MFNLVIFPGLGNIGFVDLSGFPMQAQVETVYGRIAPMQNQTQVNQYAQLENCNEQYENLMRNISKDFYPRTIIDRTRPQFHELKHKNLCAVSINVNSINSQYGITKLEILARYHDADLIFVQETSFDPNVNTMPWPLNGYHLVSLENKKWGKGNNVGFNGGCAIFVKNSLKHHCKTINFSHSFEKVQICAVKFDKLTFINCYRSPNQGPEEALALAEYMRNRFPKSKSVIFGDWNLNQTDFQSKTAKSKDQRAIVKAFEELNLTQHVVTPTHDQNIIDLCLTQDREHIKEVFVDYEHKCIDKKGKLKNLFVHHPVIVHFATRPNFLAYDVKKDHKNVEVYKFKRMVQDRLAAIRYEHEIMHFKVVKRGDPNFCFCGAYNCELDGLCKCGEYCNHEAEIETRNEDIAGIIKESFDQCCPDVKMYHYSPSKNRISKKVIKTRKKIINMKKRGDKKYVQALEERLQEYISMDMEKEVEDLVEFWNKAPNNIYITLDRAKKGKPKSNGLYKDIDNDNYDITYDPEEQSNILLKHGSKVLIRSYPEQYEWNVHVPPDDAAPYPAKLYETEITEDLIAYVIDELLNKKFSSSKDGVSVFMLKTLEEVIVPSLCRLYKLSYAFKYLPKGWRLSKQTYIPKKAADLCNPNNLRGLNVCSCLYFPLEYLLCSSQYKQLERRKAISEHQYGFRELLGCELQLIHFYDELTHILQRNDVAMGMTYFFDFEKAFDKVDMLKLNEEMMNHGFANGTGKYFQSWMVGASQYVRVQDKDSETIDVTSGIRQGSIYSGKIGFTLMINDLFEEMIAEAEKIGIRHLFTIKSYADDTKYFIGIRKDVPIEVQMEWHQHMMDTFVRWTVRKRMFLNSKKCKMMMMGGILEEGLDFEIYIDGKLMEFAEREVDLGLITVPSLSWRPHLTQKTNDALRVITTVKDIVPRVSYPKQLMLYNALVRSTLIYASVITYPEHDIDRKLLRKVFKAYWKMAGKAPNGTKLPITPLQFCLWKEIKWFRKAIFSRYPFSLGPYEDVVPRVHGEIRKMAERIKKSRCADVHGGPLRDFTVKRRRLLQVRKNSFRYRNIEIFQKIPVDKLLRMKDNEFKEYCLTEFIPQMLPEEHQLSLDAHSGEIRRSWLRKIHFIKNMQNTTTNPCLISDSEDEPDPNDNLFSSPINVS